MADSGTFKHWIAGSPDGTVEVVANGSGSFKYWLNGSPKGTVYPAAAAASTYTGGLLLVGVGGDDD